MHFPVSHGRSAAIPQRRAAVAASTAFLGLALAFTAAPASAETTWIRIAHLRVPIPETLQSPPYAPMRTRLACRGLGEALFLSDQGTLHSGGGEPGSAWKATPAVNTTTRSLPLALGWEGSVFWGGWRSSNDGATWVAPDSGNANLFTAAAIPYPGRMLGGTFDGRIVVSADSGRAWKTAYAASFSGSLIDLANTHSGLAFAATYSGSLLASGDAGATWSQVKAPASDSSASRELPVDRLTVESPAYLPPTLWMAEHLRTGRWGLAELPTRAGGGLDPIRRPGQAGFPDSQVTALAVAGSAGGPATTLWVGTWGQGVFISQDRGETWTARNRGLDDLHVKALCVPREGWGDSIYVFTRDGSLYRQSAVIAEQTGLSQGRDSRAPGGSRLPLISAGRIPLFVSPLGIPVGPDGRKATRPNGLGLGMRRE